MESGSAASEVALRASALFARAFGRAPTHGAWASGRVNLIGDHVDYAGGRVLPMALARGTAVAIAPAAAGQADRFTSEWSGDEEWMRYARGVLAGVREALAPRAHALGPVDIAVASDLPVGAGLSSSAALEVGVARAALALAGAALEPRELALLCQRAEHEYAGVPCGIMDQWCVSHAAPGQSILLDCAALESRTVALPEGLRIELVDSGIRHALRDGGYAARRADVEEAAARLGVRHLARLEPIRWPEIEALAPRIARRARHVVREDARTVQAADAIAAGELERLGALMLESHASLRDDFDVSTPELDAIVADAMARGALGARMTGAGFGGSVVVAWRRSGPPGAAGG